MILRPNFKIDNKEKMVEAVERFQILPFFSCSIRGLSVEEMCSPGMLFGGNYEEGCWEWKGPVIREKIAAYGKFFNRKAGFIGLDLLPDFLNYRRAVYPIKTDSTEEMLLDIIRENDSLTSTEIKRLIFGDRKRIDWRELPGRDEILIEKPKRKSLESPLQRLQMAGRIIINDFEYKKTKSGVRYGWGIARYSTPEIFFDEIVARGIKGRSPLESLEYIILSMKKKWSFITKRKAWYYLLK